MELDLSALLGKRKVGLNTPLCLSRYFRDQVLAEAEPVYAAAWSPSTVAAHAGYAREAIGLMRDKPRVWRTVTEDLQPLMAELGKVL